MKPIIVSTLFLLSFAPAYSNTPTEPTPITTTDAANAAEAATILNRLNEINAMDKSSLSFSEKKTLRKEVRASKKRMNQIGGGVYVSAGALILILVLLIILL